MGTNPREVVGSRYRLTVVEKVAQAPPFVDKMFRELLDEMDAQGNFSFHPKGELEPALQVAERRVLTRIQNGEIVVSMRAGAGRGNSVYGSLYPPPGRNPAELIKEMNRRLEYLNGDGWPVLGGNAEAEPVHTAPPMKPIMTAPPSPQPTQAAAPAPNPTSQPTVAPTQAPVPAQQAEEVAGKYKLLAERLFKRAKPNAMLAGHQIRDCIRTHYHESGNRYFVVSAIVLLEQTGVFRRVSREGMGEWQFTRQYLEAHGHSVPGFHELPEVKVQHRNHRPGRGSAPVRKRASASLAVSPAVRMTSAPAPAEPSASMPLKASSTMAKLARLHEELGRLLVERKQREEAAHAANHAFGETQEKIDAVKHEIIATSCALVKEQSA